MTDENIKAGPPEPRRDLPPVRPPSGRFIAQLFLVPGLIVFFVVLLVLAINYMFVGGQTSDQLLVRIDSKNSDIRWRGANDLAQMLKRRNSPLRHDPAFAFQLVDRLDKAKKELDADEKAIGDANKNDTSIAPFRKLEAQRNFVNFLMASLGEFSIPVGVPILCDVVVAEGGADPAHGSMRRRAALLALSSLGVNLKEFATLNPTQRAAILGALSAEAKSDNPVRRKAAKTALAYLGEIDRNDPDVAAVDVALDAASSTKDVHVREVLGHTLNFWKGPLVESTLLRLTKDDGRGQRYELPDED